MDRQTAEANFAFNQKANEVEKWVQRAIDSGKQDTDTDLTAKGITYNILELLGLLPREKN